MAELTREIFLKETSELISHHGCDGVSLSMILKACGAQKGSLYYFFPDGRQQLFVAAIEFSSIIAESSVRDLLQQHDDAGEAISGLAIHFGKLLQTSKFKFGMPFSALAAISGASNEDIRRACEQAFLRIESVILHKLKSSRCPVKAAKQLTSLIISILDGAQMQARMRLSAKPFRDVVPLLKSVVSAACIHDR